MWSLQQRVTRGVNARRRVYGPLWQGRYKAKLVEEQRDLDRLLTYIHLNPVVAGLVEDLRSRPRTAEVVRARETLVVIAVERYGLCGVDLAREMSKSPDTLTKVMRRATQWRVQQPKYADTLDMVDTSIAARGIDSRDGGFRDRHLFPNSASLDLRSAECHGGRAAGRRCATPHLTERLPR